MEFALRLGEKLIFAGVVFFLLDLFCKHILGTGSGEGLAIISTLLMVVGVLSAGPVVVIQLMDQSLNNGD